MENKTSLSGIAKNEGAAGLGGSSPFRILLVSHYCPTRAHAGGLRILDIYAQIRERFPAVQLDLFTHNRPSIDWSIDEARKIFDHVCLSPVSDLTPVGLAALRKETDTYDVIDLQFHPAGFHLNDFRRIGKKILFTPMESLLRVLLINIVNSLKTFRKIPLAKLKNQLREAREEIRFCREADTAVCVSRPDELLLKILAYPAHIRAIETCLSKFELEEVLSGEPVAIAPEKKDMRVIFVAYFGSETNVNALRWYLDHVHPIVKARVPGYVLSVVGRGDLSSFSKYKDDSVDFVGEVSYLAPPILKARVGIAPALSGSGFRGKVNLYSILGVPSVVSPIAAKGLVYTNEENILVARRPELFAEQCIRLLTDLSLNRKISLAAQKICLQNYVWESKWKDIYDTYNLANAPRVESGE